MKSKILILIILSLNFCQSNKKNNFQDNNTNKKSLLNKIQIQSDYHLSKDSNDFKEYILINNQRELVQIDDTIKVLSIPIEGHPIRNDYILFVTSNSEVFSSIRINGNWLNNDELTFDRKFRFLSDPLIYLEDINNDDFPELIIKDRLHNGNLFNAATKRIFSLNDMKIKYLGDFEYISYLPVEEEFMVRYWETHSNTVNVYLKKNLTVSVDSTMVGKYQIHIENDKLLVTEIEILFKYFENKEHLIPSLGLKEY